jgi:SAM-dependent methyltransferase
MTPAEHGHGSAAKRLNPRFWWDHDWYVLTRLRRGIEAALRGDAGLRAGLRVLDLGCGSRPYEPLFHTAGADYVACDLDGDVDVRIDPGRPIPLPDGAAAGAVSFQVLEHVWDLDWYLGECRRLLQPGGWLLLSTHGTWLYHPHPTDFRRWTRDGLVGELQARGFEVQTVRSVVGPLAWTTQFRLFGLRHVLLKVPVLGPLLLVLFTCLMNLRMVVEDAVTPAGLRDTNSCVYVVLARKPAAVRAAPVPA